MVGKMIVPNSFFKNMYKVDKKAVKKTKELFDSLETKLERGNRIYNGLPSKLMNDIYDGLIDRYGSLEELRNDCPHWDIFSLYLARTCGVIERKNER